MMDKLSVLRVILKQNYHNRVMKKSNKKSNQPKEVSLTVDGMWGMATSAWSKIRESKLTIRVDRV